MSLDMALKRAVGTAGAVLVIGGALATPIRAERIAHPRDPQTATGQRSGMVSTVTITPVEGPSTLHHLGLTIEGSTMGRVGQWGSPALPHMAPADEKTGSALSGGALLLTGADLYRISCRACHKADGTGAPPKIHSLVGPIRAASVRWMTADMKAQGRDPGATLIQRLTTTTETDVRTRLRYGGHNMPVFDQMSDQEYELLRPYLDELAGLPNPKLRGRSIAEPADRVGELVVKGTCHICHDATQATERPTTVLSRGIPSLASFLHGKTVGDFVAKARAGAPVLLDTGVGIMSRGRMPLFDYLTEQELSSAYSYLLRYRPR